MSDSVHKDIKTLGFSGQMLSSFGNWIAPAAPLHTTAINSLTTRPRSKRGFLVKPILIQIEACRKPAIHLAGVDMFILSESFSKNVGTLLATLRKCCDVSTAVLWN